MTTHETKHTAEDELERARLALAAMERSLAAGQMGHASERLVERQRARVACLATVRHGFSTCPVCHEETACSAPGILAEHGNRDGMCSGGGRPCAR
jgi:hypothetical protein